MTDDQEPQSFMEYWNEVDAALMQRFGIDTSDAGIEPDEIAGAHRRKPRRRRISPSGLATTTA